MINLSKEDKIKLADQVISLIENSSIDITTEIPVMIGTLQTQIGINGFKKAQIGTPVFEFKDKYLIYLETLNGDKNVEVSYYKDTLKQSINFNTLITC